MDLASALESYVPADDAEAAHVRAVRALLASGVDPWARTTFVPGHLTGSAFVVAISSGRVLLHRHRKLDRWLQFGGHDEGERDVLATAVREAREESGLEAIVPAHAAIPLDVDVHAIPTNAREPAHLHHDVRFLLTVAEEARGPLADDESDELAWLTFDDAARLLDEGGRRALRKIPRLLYPR